MNEVEITLGIALLLTAGLVFAKVAQLIRLPSVTGYILAGLVLGPSFLGIISMESVGHRLDHFTQFALMLIAFGIGEHIELRRLVGIGRDVGYISIVQALGAFFLVAIGTYLTSWLIAGAAVNHLDTFWRTHLATGATADTTINIETGTSSEGFLRFKGFGGEAGCECGRKYCLNRLFQDSWLHECG